MKYHGEAEAIGQRILAQFQSGNLPEVIAPVFIHTGNRHADGYSWGNQLIVALWGYSDARGYNQWLTVGRHVRKGEKAFGILKPFIKKLPVKNAEGAEELRPVPVGFGAVKVFGLEQTDIHDEALWEKHRPDSAQSREFLASLPFRDVAESWGLSLTVYRGREDAAHGWYRYGHSIALGVENLSTWAHEMIHAADDRNGNLRGSARYSAELVAEFGGAILLSAIGLREAADIGGAYKYVTNWAQGRDPVRACMELLDRTCKAVALVLDTAKAIAESEEYAEETNSAA